MIVSNTLKGTVEVGVIFWQKMLFSKLFLFLKWNRLQTKKDWIAFMSQPYWVEVKVEVELRLKWGWYEIESKLIWNWVEFSWGWDKLSFNKGRNWAFIGVGL